MTPTWRKPFGMFLILFIILGWSIIVVNQVDWISKLSVWLQLPIYLFAGLIWIAPLKPLLQWMETGSFRKPTE